MIQPPTMVGLFGLPTQKKMEAAMTTKMTNATEDLKSHVKKELRLPMLLVSAASIAVLLYLASKALKG